MMIEDHTEEIRTLHAEHFTQEPTSEVRRNGNGWGQRLVLSNEEVISRARSAKNGLKLEKLWRGDTNGYESHSEADLALLGMLAFWTQDEAQLESLFWDSSLVNSKWETRPDYRHRTIRRALAGFFLNDTSTTEIATNVAKDSDIVSASPSPSPSSRGGQGRKLKA